MRAAVTAAFVFMARIGNGRTSDCSRSEVAARECANEFRARHGMHKFYFPFPERGDGLPMRGTVGGVGRASRSEGEGGGNAQREHFQRCDRLRLIIGYRRKVLESLVQQGEGGCREDRAGIPAGERTAGAGRCGDLSQLIAAINHAKDHGDPATLRRIADDRRGSIGLHPAARLGMRSGRAPITSGTG